MVLTNGWRQLIPALALLALVIVSLTNGRTERASAAPVTVYGVTASNPPNLISFSSAAPGTILTSVPITGLLTQVVAGTPLPETIVGIDFRPSTGVLYGVGFVASSQHVYTINTTTGVATPVSPTSFTASLAGSNFGVTFEPGLNQIRLISPFGLNILLNPTTGQVASNDTPLSNNLTGAAVNPTGCQPGLYVIDFSANALGVVSSPGTVTPIGSLTIDAQDRVGFDIGQDGIAYASMKLTIIASDPVNFYTINLTTGAATLVGAIGGTNQVTGMAVQDGPIAATLCPSSIIYGVTASNPPNLITFSSIAPGTILSSVPITGLLTQVVAGTPLPETIVGIDFRPSTGVLYAVGFVGSSQHVYTINTTTGVATPVSPTSFAASLAGSNFGLTFNPATDLIRLISPFGLNLRLSPTTGQVVATDVNTINGIAGAAQTTGGVYVIDTQTDNLGMMANGNTGIVTVLGLLGVTAADRVGFDIASDGTAFASMKLSIIASDPLSGFSKSILLMGRPRWWATLVVAIRLRAWQWRHRLTQP